MLYLIFKTIEGLLLTLDDAGVENIKVVGPSGVNEYMKATRNFMRQLGSFNTIHDKFDIISHREKEITFHAIPLPNSQTNLCANICYVGETPVIIGKFDVETAVALGVPKGPLFGKLKSGQSITLDDGSVVTPNLVLGETLPSKYFAIICDISQHDIVLQNALFHHTYFNQ